MKIKLCAFADEAGPLLSEQIKALNENHISLIEIRGVNGKNILTLTDEEITSTYQELKKHNIDVWSIGSPIGKVELSSDLDEYMSKVERACQIANMMHCENVRMFSFFNAYNDKKRVIHYLKKMVEIGQKYNVKMCHENEKGIYGDIESRVSEILNEVPGLFYVYDPANYIQCHQDPNESISKLFDRTYYFHIKDCLKENGEVVPAGEGDGHLNEIISKLHNDKVLTIEPHLRVFDGYNKIDKEELKNKYYFPTNREAFDCAISSTKKLLKQNGFVEENTVFIKK